MENSNNYTTSSDRLTRAVLTWLELNGHYASCISSHGKWGIDDIIAVIDDKKVIIEIKAGEDHASKVQSQIKPSVEKSKGINWAIGGFDCFMTKYNELTRNN